MNHDYANSPHRDTALRLDRPRGRLILCAAITALICLVLTPFAAARIAVVEIEDGNTYEGELVVQTASVVVLSVGGIEVSFPQSEVVKITLRQTAEEIYQARRAQLQDDDDEGRLALAELMYQEDALSLARRELLLLQRDFPENLRVPELLTIVEAKLRLEQTRSERPDLPSTEEIRSDRQGPTEDRPYLTPEQISLVRVYEVDLQSKPRVSIPERTLDEFFARYGDREDVPRGRQARIEFKRSPGHEQLALLFRVQARDLYDQIDIRTEPSALSQYRRSVNKQYVASYFVPLFGQGALPGLVLFNDRPDHEAEAYTNFFLLATYSDGGRPLIDRKDPESSLLLQWGLDREAAKFPAPDVPGWKPKFRSTQDADFQRYVQWIDSLYDSDPNYGIVYPP